MSPMNSNLERPAAPAKRRRLARTGLVALLVVTLSAACIPHALAPVSYTHLTLPTIA